MITYIGQYATYSVLASHAIPYYRSGSFFHSAGMFGRDRKKMEKFDKPNQEKKPWHSGFIKVVQ